MEYFNKLDLKSITDNQVVIVKGEKIKTLTIIR